jgi:hypothetical protein
MVKKKFLKFSLELIFVLVIILGGLKILENRRYSVLYDSDEVAWIFTGYYFNLYFLRLDFLHPDWTDYEAFDHPPLGKYIVGGSLFLMGYTIDSVETKRFWNSIPLNKFPTYFEFVKHKIPNPSIVIPSLRSIIFVFALSSLLLIYISVRILYGVLPAFVSAALIAINPIFYYVSIWILAEPILLFFYALFILFCVLYLKSQRNVYIILAFIVSSFAFLTKLNGILLIPVLVMILLMRKKFLISKRDVKFVIAGFFAFLLISILLNPAFLNNGFKAIEKMVEARLAAFRLYQETFPDVALLSVKERFIAATQMIFFDYSVFYRLLKIPLEFIMFGFGIYYIFRKRDILLTALFIFQVVIPISFLPYKIIKYYYWIFPFTHMIAGISLNLFNEMLSKKGVLFVRIREKFYQKAEVLGNKVVNEEIV